MSLPRLELDFATARRPPGLLPLTIVVTGMGALLWAGLMLYQLSGTAAGLQLRIAQRDEVGARARTADSLDPSEVTATAAVASELATPWSPMLADLEAASRASEDDVALLTIEPDRKTHKVKLLAEARSLHAALAYVQRLQKLPALRNALLDSHVVQADSPEHPVRVQITADWRQGI